MDASSAETDGASIWCVRVVSLHLLPNDDSRPDGNPTGQLFYIPIVHTNTPFGDPFPDGSGIVCSMDAVSSSGQAHPHRAVRSQAAAWAAVRVGNLVDDMVGTGGGLCQDLSDCNGIRTDDSSSFQQV